MIKRISLIFVFIFIFGCSDNSFEKKRFLSDELEYYLAQGDDLFNSKSHLEKLNEILIKVELRKDDSLKAKLLIDLADEYNNLGEDSSYVYLNRSVIRLSLENGDSIRLGEALFNLGLYNYQQDKLDSAYAYYYRSDRVYNQLRNAEKSGKAILSMAIVQKNIRDYVGSEANSINAIELLEPSENWRYLASAYNNLGNVSRRMGNYSKAIEYYEKAVEYREKQRENRILNAGSYNNIGLVYKDKGEYDKAIDFYNRGLAYDSLFYKRPKTYARLLDNLAYARFLSNEKADYPSLFEIPLRIRDSIDDRLGLATNNFHIADYYYQSGFHDEAKSYARIALDISKSIPYNRGVLESLELLTEVNPPIEALKYSKERIRISDSIQVAQRRYQDQFARIRYESEELEEENTKVTQRLKWSINSILGLLVLGLASYIIIQRRIARGEINHRENQQRANEEIYSLMLAQQGKLEEGKQIEKQRISEELHDSVLGRLFGIRLSLAGLNNKEGEKVVETRKKFIDELKGLGQEIRQISHDLNATTFAADRLYEEVVENLIQTQCERFELDYDFETDPDISWETIPDTHKVHLYRIIQESLQNISKHAKASTVSVRFRKEQLHHMLKIKDDGVGMEKKKNKKGIGLKNMESRVAKIKGKLYIEGKPDQGTELVITFP